MPDKGTPDRGTPHTATLRHIRVHYARYGNKGHAIYGNGKFELNATIGIEAVLVKIETIMKNRFSKNIIVVCSRRVAEIFTF